MRIIEGFKIRTVMGESVVVGEGVEQIDFNKLVTLNTTATYLWKSVENKDFTVDDLVEILIKKYNVPLDLALKDAAYIADEWVKNGLVRR